MHIEPRETAVAESYPTFWMDNVPTTHPVVVAPEEAYSMFVDRAEEELPETEEELPEDAVPSES